MELHLARASSGMCLSKWAWIVAGVAIGLFPWMLPARTGGSGKQVTVVLRVDDYNGRSASKEFWAKLFDGLRSRNLPATIGVTPNIGAGNVLDPDSTGSVPLDEASARPLMDAMATGRIEAALHGWTHRTAVPGPPYTEFAGVPFLEQLAKATQGKELLERVLSIQIKTFIPPYNSYDDSTLIAVERAGISTFSADWRFVRQITSSLRILPATCDMSQVQMAVAAARESRSLAPTVVILMHPYDVKEVDPKTGYVSYADLFKRLDWLASQEDVAMLTLEEAANRRSQMDLPNFCNVAQVHREELRLCRLLPTRLLGGLSYGAFYPSAVSRDVTLWCKVLGYFTGVLLAGIGIVKIVALKVFSRYPKRVWPTCLGSVVVLVSVIAWALRDRAIRWPGFLAATCCLALVIGLYLTHRMLKCSGSRCEEMGEDGPDTTRPTLVVE